MADDPGRLPELRGEKGETAALRAASAPTGSIPCLGNLLRASVLDGWPALQVAGDDGPIPLPIVRPCEPSGADGYVSAALAAYVEYSPGARAALGELLAAGRQEEPMPAYRSDHWQWWTGRLSAARGSRGAGVLARAVLLTVRADLGDGSLDRPGSEDFAAQQWDIDRSDAFGQRANGRLALHRLGAWPWALCAAGRLPHGWSGRAALARLEQPGDEFVEALWHWAGSLLARQARDVRRVAATLN